MGNGLGSDIVVSGFEIRSCYCIQFHTNSLLERYEPSHSPRYGLSSITAVLLQWLWHYITHEGWNSVKQRNLTKSLPKALKPLCKSLNILWGECPRGVMANALDCGLEVSEFKFHSPYCITFKLIFTGKVWPPPALSHSYGLNNYRYFLLQWWF